MHHTLAWNVETFDWKFVACQLITRTYRDNSGFVDWITKQGLSSADHARGAVTCEIGSLSVNDPGFFPTKTHCFNGNNSYLFI
jgi:hypothetical protein